MFLLRNISLQTQEPSPAAGWEPRRSRLPGPCGQFGSICKPLFLPRCINNPGPSKNNAAVPCPGQPRSGGGGKEGQREGGALGRSKTKVTRFPRARQARSWERGFVWDRGLQLGP